MTDEKERLVQALREGDDETFVAAIRSANPGGADLKVPPDPFMHGPCRFNKANGYKEDCPYAAVLPGSACAAHLALVGTANVAAGYDFMGKIKLNIPPHSGQKRDRGKAKAAAKSRARNRR